MAPHELREAVVGDFLEEFTLRASVSRRAASRWLWYEVGASLGAWLHYWITRPWSAHVLRAVGLGLGVTALGLLLVDRGPILDVLHRLPAAFFLPVGWGLEGALVAAAAYLTSRVAGADAKLAAWGLGAPLGAVPVVRWIIGGGVGPAWLALKLAMIATCVVAGATLSTRGMLRGGSQDIALG